ncbi:hypothetical protein [Nitrosomonas sp.]|uniref:hypothetical protein n=1 Tax=Nitrosomonas sp. TaxID=42353 RepID=UPI0025E43D17|nr:hypothetical protein [Nitrosomonas sp.]
MAITTSINLADLDGSNGFRLDMEAGSSLRSVSNAGDVNGDGFADVMVSLDRASVYVVFGESTGFDATMHLTDLDGIDGFRLWGGGRFAEISDAGDVDGDGFDDVIFSSSSKGTNVVFGKAGGFGAAMNVSTLDGSNGFHLDGVIRTVSNAGDVNGDGFDDVILGNSDADLNGSIFDDEGSNYVVFGKAAGFDAAMDVSSLDGSNGFRLNGGFRRDEAGASVSAAGDVNGDGFDDVIIGAPGANQYGSSYVVFGRAVGFDAVMNLSAVNGSNGFRLDMNEPGSSSVSNAGDVNGDGFDDVIVGFRVVFGKASGFGNRMNLSDLDGSNGFSLDESSKLNPAGDVNGDGFDDLMVADRYGSSYVAFGKASGFDATVNLIPLNGSVSFVSGAGDVNGDGLDDLMAGTAKFGYVVFSSSDFTGSAAYLGTPGDDVRTGTPTAEIFYASDGDDTLIGGGGADTIRGGDGNDTIRVSDLDFLRVDGGGRGNFDPENVENDTLALDGSGINLDLTVVGDKIAGIEIIDLSGTGDNTLTLTAADMLDLPRNANNTLMVKGNAGDQVVLDSGWVDRGFQGEFHMFSTQDEAVLMVADAVSTDFVNGGHMNLSDLNGNNGFRLDGTATYGYSGRSVSSAGDVNGDGFDDVIIGPGYVVFGKASGFDAAMNLSTLDGSNGFRLSGASSVSNAGDVNGDGFGDVIVGASFADPNGSDSGSSYVVFGKASGFGAAMDLSSLDGNNGFRLDGEAAHDESGRSVSSAGDVNGDGFDDVIIGAPRADSDGSDFDKGSSYVVFGKASGFDAAMNLSTLDGSDGFRLDGELSNRSGSSVSSAGDVNGDGFDDVIIGAPGAYGSSYVVFGKATEFDATMNLSELDGSNGFRMKGGAYDILAGSVSNAGDVNGDGFDDLIISTQGIRVGDYYYGYSYTRGGSYVVFGKASGFDAVMDLSSLDGSNGFRLNEERDYSGVSVSGAGDVNGDGFDDLIIADPDEQDRTIGIAGSSSSYVMFGKASGFDAVADLSDLEGDEGFRLDGMAKKGILVTSVSGAGDVNGDGFDDLIAGAPGADLNGKNSGSSYVIFGRSDFIGGPDFLGTSGDDVFTGTPAAESFVTFDGDDRMIGGGGADSFAGGAGDDVMQIADAGFVFVDGGTGFDTLELAGGGFDLNLSSAGDKMQSIEVIDMTGNGDHKLILSMQDVLNLSDETNTLRIKGDAGDSVAGLGSGWVDGGIQGDVRTYIHFQHEAVLQIDVAVSTDFVEDNAISLFSLNGSNGFRLDGVARYDYSGHSVSDAGDVNGDGFDDVIIGARSADPNGNGSGSSYVVFGKASGFDATMDLSGLDGSNGFRLDGGAKYDYSGYSVSSAGDVNGDGFDDVIIGARGASVFSGSSYVVFGKASGFDAAMDLSSLDGANGFRLDGEAAYDDSGHSVSNAGDVNGDGFDDVIIGARSADPNGNGSGSSYVVFGKAFGFAAVTNLSSLDGDDGFRLNGSARYDFSGYSVSRAGDVNGDGFDDVIIGVPGANSNGNDSGSSYVLFGKASGFDAAMNLSSLDGANGFRLDGESAYDDSGHSVSSAGDVNGDGFDDLIIDVRGSDSNHSYVLFGKASGFNATMDLSGLDGSNGFRLNDSSGYTTGHSVSSAGDINGDGFDDVIIGALGSGSYYGYVVFGRASGFDAVMNLSGLGGSNGFRLNGGDGYSAIPSVSSAGDVNGDGFDDLIVGVERADPNGDVSGSSYIIFGRSDFTGDGVDFFGTSGDDILTGTSAAESFVGGGGNDRMIGRGGADSFDGGAGNDYIRISDDNFQFVDGGSSTDTLGLSGSGLNLDLPSVVDKIHGIETIALYGTGDNMLTLTAQDVIDLSGETNTLKIKGNAGDSVVGLNSGWTDGGIHGNFHTYTQGDAVVLVGVNVATDFPVI